MKLKDWMEKWGLTSLQLKAGFLEVEWTPKDPDRRAAWELYIELITRVATQYLPPDDGDEATALTSIFKLFDLSRTTLKQHHGCDDFAKIAVAMLNQRIRPFTAKWHRLAEKGTFKDNVDDVARARSSCAVTITRTGRGVGGKSGASLALGAWR